MSSTLTGTPTAPLRLTRQERTASMTLGAVFALRLLGIFLILPVFSVWAQTLDGGTNAFMVGLALGVYGLTQAVLQIPFGAASDRFGRKPVIVTGLLIFIFGSLLAYTADDITTLLFARALQGAGAVSAAVTAMISDSVRDKLLTRAMAFVGASIGITTVAQNTRYSYDAGVGYGKITEEIVVDQVSSGSIAAQVGLQQNDRVTAFVINGVKHELDRCYDFTDTLLTLRPGDTISFEITRGSETATTSSYQLVWGDFRTLS